MDCFFFIEFFLYLQYFLVRCTNPFYRVLTGWTINIVKKSYRETEWFTKLCLAKTSIKHCFFIYISFFFQAFWTCSLWFWLYSVSQTWTQIWSINPLRVKAIQQVSASSSNTWQSVDNCISMIVSVLMIISF